MDRMLFSITRDIAGFFMEYAPVGCLTAGVAVLCYLLYAGCGKRIFVLSALGDRKPAACGVARRAVYIFLLVLYVYIVIGITILSRSESGTREVSFRLFRTFRNTFMAKKQIYENIIMFVPYGILTYILAEPLRRLRVSLVLGAGSSLLIEVTQWVTQTGYFEADDILTNTIGMITGYAVCVLVYKLKDEIRKMLQR